MTHFQHREFGPQPTPHRDAEASPFTRAAVLRGHGWSRANRAEVTRGAATIARVRCNEYVPCSIKPRLLGQLDKIGVSERTVTGVARLAARREGGTCFSQRSSPDPDSGSTAIENSRPPCDFEAPSLSTWPRRPAQARVSSPVHRRSARQTWTAACPAACLCSRTEAEKVTVSRPTVVVAKSQLPYSYGGVGSVK